MDPRGPVFAISQSFARRRETRSVALKRGIWPFHGPTVWIKGRRRPCHWKAAARSQPLAEWGKCRMRHNVFYVAHRPIYVCARPPETAEMTPFSPDY